MNRIPQIQRIREGELLAERHLGGSLHQVQVHYSDGTEKSRLAKVVRQSGGVFNLAEVKKWETTLQELGKLGIPIAKADIQQQRQKGRTVTNLLFDLNPEQHVPMKLGR
ncbi:MAG TPA: hypothetical protein VI874_03585, partial [Candidatus Norongarragalinales archaeon]|nr:hypothetical protein [Candidatus Norongarragalinales archaeon]